MSTSPGAEAQGPGKGLFLRTAGSILVVLAALLTGYALGTQTQGGLPTGAASLSPTEIEQRIEADDVELVYTQDPALNCAVSVTADGQEGKGGCVYMGTQPERIYLSPDLPDSQHVYVLIHEYAHILQGRGEWPVGETKETGSGSYDSECWADIYAASQGVPYSQLHYLPTCVGPGAVARPSAP